MNLFLEHRHHCRKRGRRWAITGAELGRSCLTGNGHATDSHGDVIRKLSTILDVALRLRIVDIANGQLSLPIGAFDAIRDLDAKPEALFLADVSALPDKGAAGDVHHRVFVAVTSGIQAEVDSVPLEHVQSNRIGNGDGLARACQLIDLEADLTGSFSNTYRREKKVKRGRVGRTLTRGSELRSGSP